MEHKKSNHLGAVAITLSIVSVGFSIFALYLADGFAFLNPKEETVAVDEVEKSADIDIPKDFKDQVYKVIDQYIKDEQAKIEAEQAPAPTGPIDVSEDDDAVLGDPDAPVTMIEFTDYQCPFCERYFTESYSQIFKNYIETGKVKYILRDFPLEPIHPEAIPAANAAECVRDQTDDETYFKYHDLIFQNQKTLSAENYKTWAKDFDIDQEEFATCVDELKFEEEIRADEAEGRTYGVRGTPGFFINGMPFLRGAVPYADFEALIESELAKVEDKEE